MNRHLHIAVRHRGGKFRRTKKFLKLLGLTAAGLAIGSGIAQKFYRKLENKVDKAVKRKARQLGKEFGQGVREGSDPEDFLVKADLIAQANLEKVKRVIDKSKLDADELLDKAGESGISRLAGWIAGGDKKEVVERSEEETEDHLQEQSWWPSLSFSY